jgi:hypothetical protein
MSFDLSNHFMKIQKSTGIPTPKMGVHWGVCGLIPSHFSYIPRSASVIYGLHSQPTPFHALTLVVNPRLRL